jgi:hypothetical protein
LHDYVARHYAQPLGRWIALDTVVPDPADPQSLNRYSYVLNNALRYSDPTGRLADKQSGGSRREGASASAACCLQIAAAQ